MKLVIKFLGKENFKFIELVVKPRDRRMLGRNMGDFYIVLRFVVCRRNLSMQVPFSGFGQLYYFSFNLI